MRIFHGLKKENWCFTSSLWQLRSTKFVCEIPWLQRHNCWIYSIYIYILSTYITIVRWVFKPTTRTGEYHGYNLKSKGFQDKERHDTVLLVPITTNFGGYDLLIVAAWITPIYSMYDIFTNIRPKNHPNVGKYTIHGACGTCKKLDKIPISTFTMWAPR